MSKPAPHHWKYLFLVLCCADLPEANPHRAESDEQHWKEKAMKWTSPTLAWELPGLEHPQPPWATWQYPTLLNIKSKQNCWTSDAFAQWVPFHESWPSYTKSTFVSTKVSRWAWRHSYRLLNTENKSMELLGGLVVVCLILVWVFLLRVVSHTVITGTWGAGCFL